MRAYLIEIPGKPLVFVTVEAEAKRRSREGGINGRYEAVDIPDTKRERVTWLNELFENRAAAEAFADVALEATWRGPLSADEIEELKNQPIERKPKVPGFCDACGRSAAGALKLSQGAELETVIAWMITAEDWQLRRVAETLNEFAADMIEAGRPH